MRTRPMLPVVVAIPGERQGGERLCRRLGSWLRQRGLRVQTLRTFKEPLLTDSDIVFVPCSNEKMPITAARIEQLWSRIWVNWYTASRAKHQGVRRAG